MPTSGNKPRLVFFGNERLATGLTTQTPILRMLIDEGYDIAAVIINAAETKSRNARQLEISQLAKEHAIPIYSPSSIADMQSDLNRLKADAGVLVAYGKIVPESIISLFPGGIINVHPSLLPRHRGPIPIESVVLGGESHTGVSLMALVRDMDAGPIYAQAVVDLDGHETKQQLADRLGETSAGMLKELLPEILAGSVIAAPQDNSTATNDERIKKQDGTLNYSKPAETIEREIRAYAGWPGSRANLAGHEVTITKAHVADDEVGDTRYPGGTVLVKDKQLCVQTADGLLVIDALKPAGKKDMSAAAFINGYMRNDVPS